MFLPPKLLKLPLLPRIKVPPRPHLHGLTRLRHPARVQLAVPQLLQKASDVVAEDFVVAQILVQHIGLRIVLQETGERFRREQRDELVLVGAGETGPCARVEKHFFELARAELEEARAGAVEEPIGIPWAGSSLFGRRCGGGG